MAETSRGGSLTTYVFRSGEAGPVVGYAAVSFRNQPHPDDASSSKAKVLVISMLGVNQAFQGQSNPSADDQSYAASVMADLEERARCNTKVGFVLDPAGPFRQDAGDPMLTMRKFLR